MLSIDQRTHLRHAHWRSLSNAYMTWLDAQPPALQIEVVAKKRRGRVVLRFRRFPALRGRVWNHCLAVYAGRESDAYRLFDVDCLPLMHNAGVFVCGFCEREQKEFSTREALWADHLFEPFGRWVTRVLMQAQAVEHKRIGKRKFARCIMRPPSEGFDQSMTEDTGIDHLRFYR